jgi:DNA-binding FrmR family transcriptional regulator
MGKMNLKDEDHKRELSLRLSRLEGQIHGINAMLASDRDCEEILQQLTAARSATNRVTELYLQHMLEDCLSNAELKDEQSRSATMGKLVHMILEQ